MASILPGDKNFSMPTFLSLVHGKTSFDELKTGLDNLKQQLQQQSQRRENLVRTHFGLFVQCADGLEWLKSFRQGVFVCVVYIIYIFMCIPSRSMVSLRRGHVECRCEGGGHAECEVRSSSEPFRPKA